MLSTDMGAAQAAPAGLPGVSSTQAPAGARDRQPAAGDRDFGQMFDQAAGEARAQETGKVTQKPPATSSTTAVAVGLAEAEDPDAPAMEAGADLDEAPVGAESADAGDDTDAGDTSPTVTVFDPRLLLLMQSRPSEAALVPAAVDERVANRAGSPVGVPAFVQPLAPKPMVMPAPEPVGDEVPDPATSEFLLAADAGEGVAYGDTGTQPAVGTTALMGGMDGGDADVASSADMAQAFEAQSAVTLEAWTSPRGTPTGGLSANSAADAAGVSVANQTPEQVAMAALRHALARHDIGSVRGGAATEQPSTSSGAGPSNSAAGASTDATGNVPDPVAPTAGVIPDGLRHASTHAAGSAALGMQRAADHAARPAVAEDMSAPVVDAAGAQVAGSVAAGMTDVSETASPSTEAPSTSMPRAAAPQVHASQVAAPQAGVATDAVAYAAQPQESNAQPEPEPRAAVRSARVAHAIAAFQAAAAVLGTGTPAGVHAAVASQAATPALLDAELPTQIIQAVRVQFSQGGGEATLRLNPGFLGGLTVGIEVDGSTVVASLHASSAEVREWIQRNEQVLRQSLADQGLQLERLVVVDEDADAARDGAPRDGRREQPEQQAPRRSRRTDNPGTFELVL